jgi:hypothetical protein
MQLERLPRTPDGSLRWRGLLRLVALASLAALGCGGSGARAPLDDAADQAGSDTGENAAGPGIEPAPATPAAPTAEGIGAGPDELAPGTPTSPLPTEVQLTSDSVQVGDGEGLLAKPLFIARSPLGTRLELLEASDRICVRGALTAVPDGDYTNYWGGEVGLILGASPASDVAPPDDGLRARGFSFRLVGEAPLQLRLRVAAAGEVPLTSQYCQDVPTNGGASIEVELQSLTFECWGSAGAAYPAQASATLVSWQIPAAPEQASSFDFCIEEIRAIR